MRKSKRKKKRSRMLQYFHTVNQLFIDLGNQGIIPPFETDNLYFVNANGLLKTYIVC